MTAPTETFDPATARAVALEQLARRGDIASTDAALDKLFENIFATLGDTADAIAAKLTELGIKGALPQVVKDGGEIYGDLVDSETSVLAMLFRQMCGATHADVDTRYAYAVWTNDAGDEIAHELPTLPTPIIEFMDRYEDFAYRALYNQPVPQEVVDYQNDPHKGIDRHEHTVRGAVKQVDDRQKFSQPMPDDLVAAIGAAGLTAEDYGDQVMLYRGGKMWAFVQGMDNLEPGRGHWIGAYGFRPDLNSEDQFQGVTSFETRDAAVQYVLGNVDSPRMETILLRDGRWQRGPLTAASRFKRMTDQVLLAALAAGLTLVQEGANPLSQIEVFRGDTRLATVGMIKGGTWQAELTDGRRLNAPNIDDMLTATIEALTGK